ncbi:ADP-ribosylation factor-like protein [Promethearchaeum syntrophicum]|uniref:ADP-ribosylation factor-like protein n=1 Tax=Promethearchaeum syntrophicum TaxID=2594042 RepID=A0A5B9DFR5_9ARCH|nr:ADP-ribosylation factor-like protein [Candidatus Prometheoarchaeum syntrophicum]QEE17895.1 hypothetical protein DSAG12_03733 [Candidatus Prometheoarchaeum syntrophicum]
MEKNPETDIMKIAMVGLANAGKTSIVKTIRKTYHIGESPSPTKSVQRSIFKIFGQNSIVWDYGGQEEYRNSYLDKPGRFLSDIRYLFFVIDIQDTNSFDEALKYFSDVYDFIHEHTPQLIVSIMFHKKDPKIAKDPEIKERIRKLKRKFGAILVNREVGYYETSVYDALTLLTSISLPILGDLPIYNKISVLFANYAIQNSVDYMNLTVDNLLELGKFRIFRKNQEFLDASMEFYKEFGNLEIDSKIRAYNFEGYRFIIVQGKVEDYDYTLNVAHPLSLDQDMPTEEGLNQILQKINELFVEYHPLLT